MESQFCSSLCFYVWTVQVQKVFQLHWKLSGEELHAATPNRTVAQTSVHSWPTQWEAGPNSVERSHRSHEEEKGRERCICLLICEQQPVMWHLHHLECLLSTDETEYEYSGSEEEEEDPAEQEGEPRFGCSTMSSQLTHHDMYDYSLTRLIALMA